MGKSSHKDKRKAVKRAAVEVEGKHNETDPVKLTRARSGKSKPLDYKWLNEGSIESPMNSPVKKKKSRKMDKKEVTVEAAAKLSNVQTNANANATKWCKHMLYPPPIQYRKLLDRP